MRVKTTFALLFTLMFFGTVSAQVIVTNGAPNVTIDFSAGMQPSIAGPGPYLGNGFSPNPTVAGRLNSNAWAIKGFDFNNYQNLAFGGTQTVDDYGRGAVNIAVTTPGLYAFSGELPGTIINSAILIQSGDADFAPGSITLRIQNSGTSNMTQLSVDYNLFVRNDQISSSKSSFSYSNDNVTFATDPLLDYISDTTPDAFQLFNIGPSPSRSKVINGINIAPGGFYYIRWEFDDATGTGERDEFALDDIHIGAVYGAPAPEINVQLYSSTILNGDMSPNIFKGTEFSPIYSPTSTVLTGVARTFAIQNLGGLNLNISSVTITGPEASEFLLNATPNPVGTVPPASTVTLFKEFTVTFDPSQPGLRTAFVNIFSNDADENPYVFKIQGYGVIPIPDIRVNGNGPLIANTQIVTHLSMIPTFINNTLFNPQTVNLTSETRGFKISNDCPYNAPVILTSPTPYIQIAGNNPGDFSLVLLPMNGIIYPGFTRTFSIKFAPTAPGIRTALITIPNNDPDEAPFTFLVQGEGQAPEMDVFGNSQPIVSGSTTTTFTNHTFFDYVNITTGFVDRVFTIKNTGTQNLTIGAKTITGPAASDFTITVNPATPVLPNAQTTMTVRFDPSVVGLRQAMLSIVNNDSDENPYVFAIEGYGLDYIPCAFGPVETIVTQDFEAVPATPVWTYTVAGPVVITGGTAFGSNGDGGGSEKFLGARSAQVSGTTTLITMAPLNTKAFSDLELNFRLASYGTAAAEGSDAADKVIVSVSVDGGVTFSSELEIRGNNNSKWNFLSGSGIANATYSGTNLPIIFNAGPTFPLTDGYSTVRVSNLPKVVGLVIRISMLNNLNEVWAVDNVSLFGRKEVFSTWNGTAWIPATPTNTIKAVIDGPYNTGTNGNIVACKCQVNPGKTLTIANNSYASVESDLDNQGTILVDSGGSLVQRDDFATNVGVIKVSRTTTPMRKFDFTYWSSPVANQTLFNFSPLTLSDKYFSWNPITGLWVTHPNGASIMAIGKGYIMRAPNNFDPVTPANFTGQFVGVANNGFIQTPIQSGTSLLNLIGNPYPSAISANSFLTLAANTTVVEGTIYLWTHNTPITGNVYTSNDYAVYNATGSVSTAPAPNSGVNNGTPTGFIASGQSFFIKAKNGGGQVTFTNGMRLTGSNNNFFRASIVDQNGATENSAGVFGDKVWLNITNNLGAFKQILIGYIDGATNLYDRDFDGEAFNGNTAINVYSLNDDLRLAIQGRERPFVVNDTVALGYNAMVAGDFTLAIGRTEGELDQQNVYVEDKLLNVIHNLKISPYEFSTEIGRFDERFVIRYTDGLLATTNFAAVNNNFVVAVKNKIILVKSINRSIQKIQILDMMGRTLHESKVNADHFEYSNAGIAQQTLLIKAYFEDGSTEVRKIIY